MANDIGPLEAAGLGLRLCLSSLKLQRDSRAHSIEMIDLMILLKSGSCKIITVLIGGEGTVVV
jgi:hypothetical protein